VTKGKYERPPSHLRLTNHNQVPQDGELATNIEGSHPCRTTRTPHITSRPTRKIKAYLPTFLIELFSKEGLATAGINAIKKNSATVPRKQQTYKRRCSIRQTGQRQRSRIRPDPAEGLHLHCQHERAATFGNSSSQAAQGQDWMKTPRPHCSSCRKWHLVFVLQATQRLITAYGSGSTYDKKGSVKMWECGGECEEETREVSFFVLGSFPCTKTA
jgi:hypothetical protein